MEESTNYCQVVIQQLNEFINFLVNIIRNVTNQITAFFSWPKPAPLQLVFMPARTYKRTLSQRKSSKKCHRRSNTLNIGLSSDIDRNKHEHIEEVEQPGQQIQILAPPPAEPRQDELKDDTAVLDKPVGITEGNLNLLLNETAEEVLIANELDAKVSIMKPEVLNTTAELNKAALITEGKMNVVQNETAEEALITNELDAKVSIMKPKIFNTTAELNKAALVTEGNMNLVRNETTEEAPIANELDAKLSIMRPEVLNTTAVLDKAAVITEGNLNPVQNGTAEEALIANKLDAKVSILKPEVLNTPPAIMQHQEPKIPIVQQNVNQLVLKPQSLPNSEVLPEKNKKPLPDQTRKRGVQPCKISNTKNAVQARPRWR